jgi:broad specificity phosphatase PhoE
MADSMESAANAWPTIYLCRHGDTAWSGERRLAGRTDLPLTEQGEQNARQLGERLKSIQFDRVISSPLLRARRTAELAGFADAVIDPRLIEMNFGQYDGRTREEIIRERPGWTYLRDGSPGGETAADLGRRADAVLSDLLGRKETVLIFGHSVILRVLTARWLTLPATAGGHFMLSPASLCMLAYDNVEAAPAIGFWNEHPQSVAAWSAAGPRRVFTPG